MPKYKLLGMANQISRSALDDFASSRAALELAFFWGLAEATFFFIVPDVLLTLVACRMLKRAMKGTIAALFGALTGGGLMYAFAAHEPQAANAFLNHVPAISQSLITSVGKELSEHGLLAVLLGPSQGIPYKLYAVECGAQGRGFLEFILISIPARYVRFFLASIAAGGIARLIRPLTGRSASIEVAILATVWIVFYAFYFSRFGF